MRSSLKRRRIHFAGSDHSGAHGNRPWVYFMVDCFFLVTQFFLITFHVRSDETLLVMKQNVGRSREPGPVDATRTITVYAGRSADGSDTYDCMQRRVTITELTELLVQAKRGSPVHVRVSYQKELPFGAVMAVFDACKLARIDACGLVSLYD